MRGNSVIIATNAIFLGGILQEKLRDVDFHVFLATNDNDLSIKIKAVFPRYIFLEHCFHGYGTDVLIQRMVKRNRSVGIVVWTVSEMEPIAAARFITAGAESFFSLRDTDRNIETILCRIAMGRKYCPADVEAELDKDYAYQEIGKEVTLRELEIIKLSARGLSNRKIGDILSLSIHTVKFHKKNIYRKYGGKTPVDILVNGIKKKIIHEEEL